MIAVSIVAGVLLISLSYLAIIAFIAMIQARAKHPVICPGNGELVQVRTKPLHAARSVFDGSGQKVCDCSRWPERADCARGCERDLLP